MDSTAGGGGGGQPTLTETDASNELSQEGEWWRPPLGRGTNQIIGSQAIFNPPPSLTISSSLHELAESSGSVL